MKSDSTVKLECDSGRESGGGGAEVYDGEERGGKREGEEEGGEVILKCGDRGEVRLLLLGEKRWGEVDRRKEEGKVAGEIRSGVT